VKLDVSGYVDDGRLAWLAGGEVAGFLGFAGTVAVGAVADEGAGAEDFQQERGERQFWLIRGKAATVSIAAARACGKLIRADGCPSRSRRSR
jgi:hypothetical protein